MTKEKLTKLRETWRLRVAEFRASGQSGATWCAAHQIKENPLWYWTHKFEGEDHTSKAASSHWLPVEIHEQVEVNESLLIRVGQAAIEVKSGFDAGLLCAIVRTLASL